jgi:signal transduction histidine kinase/phage shock protein PspC (stress-responsive transcriptional regulator)
LSEEDLPPWQGPWWNYAGHRSGPPWHRHRRPRHRGPLRRSKDARFIAGIAEGLSKRTGIDVTIVRVGLVLFGLASGTGVAAYVLAWLFLPEEGETGNIAQRALVDRRGITVALAFAPALVAFLIIGAAVGAGWLDSIAWPAFVSAAGLVLIWRNAPEYERAVLDHFVQPALNLAMPEGRSFKRISARVVVGVVLLAGGLTAILMGHPSHIFLRLLGGVVLVLGAFVVVFGPWWLGVARDLVVERQARALAEERANMATRVHDSVLQTLALIQRRADNPQEVSQLARAQERELRSWLFSGGAPGASDGDDETVGAGVQRIQREVESAHGTEVEVVTVGDCDLDDNLRELLAAAREATVNSAKWSGAPVVSLFAEVEPEKVSIFVRDRGTGFDEDAVPPDRKGVSESIYGRMGRHGGTAEVRSSLGEGTDVALEMPRQAGRKARRAG